MKALTFTWATQIVYGSAQSEVWFCRMLRCTHFKELMGV